mgnify:CR=1 FL=1
MSELTELDKVYNVLLSIPRKSQEVADALKHVDELIHKELKCILVCVDDGTLSRVKKVYPLTCKKSVSPTSYIVQGLLVLPCTMPGGGASLQLRFHRVFLSRLNKDLTSAII